MRTASWVTFVVVLILAVFGLALCVSAQNASSGKATTGTPAYGPCCPLVKGQTAPSTASHKYWHKALMMKGPRFECQLTNPVKLEFGNVARHVNALEVMGNILVPVRSLAITGATVDYQGSRTTLVSMGARNIKVILGHHEVSVQDKDSGKTVENHWDLCPRLRDGITYVPLRPAADALGMGVSWEHGTAMLTTGGPETPGEMSQIECPADQIEKDYGVKVLRGPLNGPYGPGIGVLSVKPGGEGAAIGLHSRDVIISCDGKPVKCPQDLDKIIETAKANNTKVHSMLVVRNQHKKMLSL